MDNLLPGIDSGSLNDTIERLSAYLLSGETAIELAVISALALVALLMAKSGRPRLVAMKARHASFPVLVKLWTILDAVLLPFNWLILQWIANVILDLVGWREGIPFITASLLTAWIVIRIASTFIQNKLLASTISVVAWSVAALNIVGWLPQTIQLLDSLGVNIGDSRLTALTLFNGISALVVLLWAASFLSESLEAQLRTSSHLTPSLQVLSGKLVKVALIATAFLTAIGVLGIDLTAFAVVGGAIGVGIGFGLQKIVSNLISGVILLLDDSIKPGDVIVVGQYYGRVNSLGARYVSVRTRDGVEHLIPNEELIINRVENWSHSDSMLRLRQPLGVHYDADVNKARALCLEAASEVPRVLKDPAPTCLLRGFGESSVDLEIRFWIEDPMNGRGGVASDILLKVWDKFHEHGIQIPYPQRDVHLRTPDWEAVKSSLPPSRS